MKALRIETFGPPSVLSLRDVPIPELQAGEALVEIHAAGVNPSDVKIVSGGFHSTLPRTVGRDYAGVVVAGEGWEGKPVWGSGPGFGVTRDGSHAQYLVVGLDWLSEKPSSLSIEEASAVGVPHIAAWSALVDAAKIQEGETLLVTGALGAVGRAAIQIAHWKKAKVIGADRFDGASEADLYLNTNGKDLPTEVKSLTEDKGVDLVLDTVGGPLFELSLKSLKVGGRQVNIASAGGRRVEFDLVDFYHNLLHLFGVDTMKLTGPDIARIMNELRAGYEEGYFQPYAVKTYALDHAVEAYTAVEKGDTSAKHVLLPR
jgi:NADPH:quinone reductase-like Zn-dependent oxidoreductase